MPVLKRLGVPVAHVLGERRRYERHLRYVTSLLPSGRVCDVGAAVPYVPLALRRLGYEVAIVDRYDLWDRYPGFASSIQRLAHEYGVQVYDLDIVAGDLTSVGKMDVALLTGVIEHLHGSPRHVLQSIRAQLLPHGALIVEVPNIAALLNRLRLLRGRSPLENYAMYFHSRYPYDGHSREMTLQEMRYALEESGFEVSRISGYDYTASVGVAGVVMAIRRLLLPMPSLAESIIAIAHVRPDGVSAPVRAIL